MPSILQGGKIIEGSGLNAPIMNAGAPTNGTDAVQTLTIGGTPTGGTFVAALEGYNTSAIPWSATNATLIASIDAALEALPNIGVGGVVTAVGTLTAGVGTITLTFSGGNLTKEPVSTITIPPALMLLTGTAPTVTNATTTPGVAATGRGCAVGAQLIDTTNAFLYINTGTALAPVWTKTGTQS